MQVETDETMKLQNHPVNNIGKDLLEIKCYTAALKEEVIKCKIGRLDLSGGI